MSGNKIPNTPLSVPKAAKLPLSEREEPPVRWPSAATSGSAVYVSNPEPKGEAAGSETSAEG